MTIGYRNKESHDKRYKAKSISSENKINVLKYLQIALCNVRGN